MSRIHLFRCGLFAVAIVLCATAVSFSQTMPATGVLTADAPAFLLPDATRTPLAILKAGTSVVILKKEGDWYQVRFRDTRFGDRTGYVAAANLQLQPGKPALPPAPRARAQTRTPPASRKRVRHPVEPLTISINGGVQTTSRAFASTSTISHFSEDGTLNSTYSSERPIVFDAAIQSGVWRTVSLSLAVTQTSKPLEGSVTTKIPHPFFFDRPRTVTGQSAALSREELVLHLNGMWTIPATRSTRIGLFAGPSYFKVTQGLVTDVVVDEAYPYDEAAFESATSIEATQSRWGYNVGFDITQLLSRRVGIGFIGRYSRASFVFPIVASENVEIRAGGFQAGGGVRFRF